MEGMMRVEGLDGMPDWARNAIEQVALQVPSKARVNVRRVSGSSNEMIEVSFGGERKLMLKRGQHDWSHDMFATSERAAELLDTRTDITAPRPLSLPAEASSDPLQAYWRIPLPTLGGLWPEMDPWNRQRALESLGRLLTRIHQIRLPGWGHLPRLERGSNALERFLHQDLAERLLPAVRALWSGGAAPIEELIGRIPAAVADGGSRAVLSHGDMHIQNVLCDERDGEIECVGLLDLDNARAAPPEWDIASFQVLHGAHFEQQMDERERSALVRGYARSLNPVLLAFLRAYHLSNLGFASALADDHFHAGIVADALAHEVALLNATIARSAA
jgi:aminoglycoside phosphotransferase (APT) family kinase protein